MFYVNIYAITLSFINVVLSVIDNVNISKQMGGVLEKECAKDAARKEEKETFGDVVMPYGRTVATTSNALMKEYVGMDMRRDPAVKGSFVDTGKKISFVENRNVNENKLSEEGVVSISNIKKRLFNESTNIKEEDEVSSKNEENKKKRNDKEMISPEKQNILTLTSYGENSNIYKSPEITKKKGKKIMINKFNIGD